MLGPIPATWLEALKVHPTTGRLHPSITHVLPCRVLYLACRYEVITPHSRSWAMPILEVTKLRLKGVQATDPTLLKNLSSVRSKLQTNSQFYNCIEDPSLIYILGIWPSLDAHDHFLASPTRSEVLGPQEEFLEFQWTIHMELDAMSSLPLNAPVMAISRLFVKAESVDAFSGAVLPHERTTEDAASKPYNAVKSWRCDAEPGKHEAVIFTGWDTAQAHAVFTAEVRGTTEHAAISQHYEGMDVQLVRNMEKQCT
ncbi:hypothetical protein CC78DRAFT_120852 [Lojkania enalia]|uniref:ABM domain-containing protein n=1 Tax=Lojkania enalia TaxID=147567 RepID=A0A9P4N563_9PLEO|nr:hypothetical protein CC78DRAFT_120852 [Didymosphaeria enalia]